MAAGAAATIDAPHGEGGKIVRANGEVFISYTYIAAPGAVGTPAMFKVFRPRMDPPDGLQRPRLEAGDVGSWAFIGEGNLASISAMMDLDANGIVTWQFMSIANLEKYRPPVVATTTAQSSNKDGEQTVVADGAVSDRAPGFPATLQQDYVPATPNDLGIGAIFVDYLNSPTAQPSIKVNVGKGFQQITYLGFNDEGVWLAPYNVIPRANNKPITVRIVDGKAVITLRDAMPRGLRNPSSTYLLDGPGNERPAASVPVNAARNDRAQQLLDLDREVLDNQGRARVLAQKKFGRGTSASRISQNYENWKAQRARECAPRGGGQADLSTTNPATIDCLLAKTRERNALYLKAAGEFEAGNLSAETAAAIGLK